MDKQIKERGIIFNAEMVRAILDGRKTQTRRVMKVQPVLNGSFYEVYGAGWGKSIRSIPAVTGHSLSSNCPFGKVGDRLWVRETFCEVDDSLAGCDKWIDYRATPKFNESHPAGWDCDPKDPDALKWKPSIHMPRWASRITLEITDVRVERLHNISREDACAEGIRQAIRSTRPDKDDELIYRNYLEPIWHEACEWFDSPIDSFLSLWESIHGPESWQHGPWVWVISFRRVEAA